MVDAYTTLGISRGASDAEIRQAWRRGVMRWHPDRNPGNPEAGRRFLDIQEAWALLGSVAARAAYDARRTTPPPGPPPPPPGAQHPPRDDGTRWRGGGRAAHESVADEASGMRGDDLQVTLRLPLASLFSPQSRKISLRTATTCARCRGDLAYCPACGGSGQAFTLRQIIVHIPAGCHDGQVLRVRGYGHDGPFFAAPGDLLLRIEWTRKGRWTWNAVRGRIETRLRGGEAMHAKGGRSRLRAPNGKWAGVDLTAAPRGAWVRVNGMGLPDADGWRAAAWIEWL